MYLKSTFVLAASLVAISSHAADYFSLLEVRYDNGLKKSFLAGPFSGKPFCEKLNQNVWDNVLPVCGTCKKELQICSEWSQLSAPFSAVLDSKPSPLVYVIATKKNRIIFSGAYRPVIEAECEATAKNFRTNGYPEARCVR